MDGTAFRRTCQCWHYCRSTQRRTLSKRSLRRRHQSPREEQRSVGFCGDGAHGARSHVMGAGGGDLEYGLVLRNEVPPRLQFPVYFLLFQNKNVNLQRNFKGTSDLRQVIFLTGKACLFSTLPRGYIERGSCSFTSLNYLGIFMRTKNHRTIIAIEVEIIRLVKVQAYKRVRFGKVEKYGVTSEVINIT